MDSKKQIIKFSHIATIFIVFVSLASALWIYFSLESNQKEQVESALPDVKIDTDLYQKIKSNSSYGVPVSIDEPGFGRVNPFANFKEQTTTTDATPTNEN